MKEGENSDILEKTDNLGQTPLTDMFNLIDKHLLVICCLIPRPCLVRAV